MTASTAFGFEKDDAKSFDLNFSMDELLFMKWALTTDKTTVEGLPTQEQIDLFKKDTNSKDFYISTRSSDVISCSTKKEPKTCKIIDEIADGKNAYDFIKVNVEKKLTLTQVNDLIELARPVIERYNKKSEGYLKYSKVYNGRKYTCVYEKFYGEIGDGPYFDRDCKAHEITSKNSIDREIYKHTIERALNPEIYAKEHGLKSIRVHSSSVHLSSSTRPRYDYKNPKTFEESIGIR